MKYKLESTCTGGNCEHFWLALHEYGVGVLMNNDYTKEPQEGESFDVGIYKLEDDNGIGEHFDNCFTTLENFKKSQIVARMIGYVEGHGFMRKPYKAKYEVYLTVNCNDEPVYAYCIDKVGIYNPTTSECGRYEVDPYEAYGLTPKQVEALHQLNVAHGYDDTV
jgi:hypothetical protein